MSMFWIGLVVGLFIGTNVAIVVVGMCVAAKKEMNPKTEEDDKIEKKEV